MRINTNGEKEYRIEFYKRIAERFVVTDGTHNAGTVRHTIATRGGAPVLAIVGNIDNPYACEIRRNQNYVCGTVKDEYIRVEGMTWGHTQFAGNGDPFCQEMVFSDRHGKSHSSVEGKRAAGRFQNCHFGHKHEPNEYSAYYYGGGSVHFDHERNGSHLRQRGNSDDSRRCQRQ